MFQVQTYRGTLLGWIPTGSVYHSQAMAERLLAIRRRVDPWAYLYRIARVD